MKYLSLALILITLASCNGRSDKTAAESSTTAAAAVSIPSNNPVHASITRALTAYYVLKNALVEADTLAASNASGELSALAYSISVEGLTDSSIITTIKTFSGSIASEAGALPQENNITEKRRAFSMITENLYPLLQIVQYQGATVYQQMCPMAFNDNEAGYWLSDSREVVNPYLGKKHPKYSGGMVHCGEVKDSINYSK